MLCLNFASKICVRHPVYRGKAINLIFSKRIQIGKERNEFLCTSSKTHINSFPLKSSSMNFRKIGNYLFCKRSVGQAAVIKHESQPKSHFQELMHFRRKQAERSVLLEISKKEDIPYALAVCERFGSIANVYFHHGQSDCLLLEFSEESSVQCLLSNCHFKDMSEAFPVRCRLIQLTKKNSDLPKVNIDVLTDDAQNTLRQEASISDLIENIYENQKLSELNTRIRYFFCSIVKDLLSGFFPSCEVLPFGSSVNGIGRHGCDLDAVIRLYSVQDNGDSELCFLNKKPHGKVKFLQQQTVHCVGDIVRNFFPGFTDVQKILNARMPILKLHHKILNIDCDISVNNMSAVLMSEIIHFCGEIDCRVRPLLYAVKKWAKDCEITYPDPGSWITNFGLTTLVLFFLQNRPKPILPPFNDAFVITGEDMSPEFRLEYLKFLEDFKNQASLNEESLAVLLKEFLIFLETYPFKESVISLMTGKAISHCSGYAICVQYPFEENLNITKNVADFEFFDICEKAKITSRCLEKNLNQGTHFKDLETALGISQTKILKSNKPKKFNVGTLLDYNNKHGNKPAKRRYI